MRTKSLVMVLSLGALVGAGAGVGMSLFDMVLNRYVSYGMYRLMTLNLLENLNRNMIYFAIGVLILYLISLVLSLKVRWSSERIYRVVFMVSLIVIGIYVLDWMLRELTGYTGVHVAKRTLARIADLFSSRITVSRFADLIRMRSKPLSVLAVGLATVVGLYLILRKLNLERIVESAMARYSQTRAVACTLVAACLVLNLVSYVEKKAHSKGRPNIVIMVIDCLRPDHMGCYGYGRRTSPNIGRLAERGLRFSKAFSNAPWTKPSVATMFTSLYPNMHKAINANSLLPQASLTMAEILKNEGYRTLFFNGGNPFISDRFRFGQGFDAAGGTIGRKEAGVLSEEFLSCLPRLRNDTFFAYLHYMDVHVPYSKNEHNFEFGEDLPGEYLEPGAISAGTIRTKSANGELAEAEKIHLVDLYDGQIKLVDQAIQSIVSALEREGLTENTLIIVCSDHGEEFWEHGNYEHGHTLYNELLHIPLIIVGAGLPRSRIESRVALIDVLPTVLEVAGIRLQGVSLQGRSLLALTEGTDGVTSNPSVFAMGTLYGPETYCLIRSNLKLMLKTEDQVDKFELIGYSSEAESELYDTVNDPLEQNNIFVTRGSEALTLRAELDGFKDAESTIRAKSTVIDEDLEERLRSVGYL
jgi:choline-sulfatase